jgi:hypothetical protein
MLKGLNSLMRVWRLELEVGNWKAEKLPPSPSLRRAKEKLKVEIGKAQMNQGRLAVEFRERTKAPSPIF